MSLENIKQLSKIYEDCDRIFSSLHCPSCGSANIRVTFKPEFDYNYVEEYDYVNICGKYERIEFLCEGCNYWRVTDHSYLLDLILNAFYTYLPKKVNIKRLDDYSHEVARLNNIDSWNY